MPTNQGAPSDLAPGSCALLPTPTTTLTATPATTTMPMPGGSCVSDRNGDGMVGVNELIAAVNAALSGC